LLVKNAEKFAERFAELLGRQWQEPARKAYDRQTYRNISQAKLGKAALRLDTVQARN